MKSSEDESDRSTINSIRFPGSAGVRSVRRVPQTLPISSASSLKSFSVIPEDETRSDYQLRFPRQVSSFVAGGPPQAVFACMWRFDQLNPGLQHSAKALHSSATVVRVKSGSHPALSPTEGE